MRRFAFNIADLVTLFVFVVLGANIPFDTLGEYLLPAAGGARDPAARRPAADGARMRLPDRRAGWTRPELGFLCWTRETGVVPAALVGVLAGLGVPDIRRLRRRRRARRRADPDPPGPAGRRRSPAGSGCSTGRPPRRPSKPDPRPRSAVRGQRTAALRSPALPIFRRPAGEPRERLGHERPGAVLRGPPITVECECGERAELAYGERWSLPLVRAALRHREDPAARTTSGSGAPSCGSGSSRSPTRCSSPPSPSSSSPPATRSASSSCCRSRSRPGSC